MSDPVDRLKNIFGGELGGKGNPGVLEKALAAVKERQDVENQKKAEELIEKALTAHKKMEELRRQYEGSYKKASKELGKLVSQIENLGKGQTATEDEDSESESES